MSKKKVNNINIEEETVGYLLNFILTYTNILLIQFSKSMLQFLKKQSTQSSWIRIIRHFCAHSFNYKKSPSPPWRTSISALPSCNSKYIICYRNQLHKQCMSFCITFEAFNTTFVLIRRFQFWYLDWSSPNASHAWASTRNRRCRPTRSQLPPRLNVPA